MIYFENQTCERCAHRLGYVPGANQLGPVEQGSDGAWVFLASPGVRYRLCANADARARNWLVPDSSAESYCTACRHNRTIPDLASEGNLGKWRKFELAKHRLFYSLIRLKLPIANRADDPTGGLVFDFLEDSPAAFGMRIQPAIGSSLGQSAVLNFDPQEPGEIDRLIQAWLPLAYSVNSINRCMGEPDLSPFVLAPAVIVKMGFIHQLIHKVL